MLFHSPSYQIEKTMSGAYSPICKEIDAPSVPLFAAPSMCRYVDRKCANARSFTRNGALHAFCYYHRVLVKRRRSSRQWPRQSNIVSHPHVVRSSVSASRAHQFNPPPSPNSFVRFTLPGDCETNVIRAIHPMKHARESLYTSQHAVRLTSTDEHGNTSTWLRFAAQIQV